MLFKSYKPFRISCHVSGVAFVTIDSNSEGSFARTSMSGKLDRIEWNRWEATTFVSLKEWFNKAISEDDRTLQTTMNTFSTTSFKSGPKRQSKSEIIGFER